MIVDYLCNAFTPDREAVWKAAITTTGTSVRVAREDDDGFAEPEAMVARMDELGVSTVLLPAVHRTRDETVDPTTFEAVANTWGEVEKLVRRWPGRFAALATVDPTRGMAGVRETGARLTQPWVVGMYVHTHSWDRRLDHADYYAYYALATEHDVPVAMQTGVSGGAMPSECGRAITIDRPALYFPDTRFLLSHTGWPWVEETVAMAQKFPNVWLGTASYPPRRWAPALVEFLQGAGQEKVVFGTNFPTVGMRRALAQVDELALESGTRAALLGGTAARIFARLDCA
jgi:uncharacterized protein